MGVMAVTTVEEKDIRELYLAVASGVSVQEPLPRRWDKRD